MIFGLILVSFIAIMSGIVTWKINNIVFRMVIVAISSFISAYLVYWVPVWLNSIEDQHSSLEQLFIQSWSVVGFSVGSLAVIISKIVSKNDS